MLTPPCLFDVLPRGIMTPAVTLEEFKPISGKFCWVKCSWRYEVPENATCLWSVDTGGTVRTFPMMQLKRSKRRSELKGQELVARGGSGRFRSTERGQGMM